MAGGKKRCILKDMRHGECSNGRGVRAKVGNKGQEDWGMTFWREVVEDRTFWRTGGQDIS